MICRVMTTVEVMETDGEDKVVYPVTALDTMPEPVVTSVYCMVMPTPDMVAALAASE
jgi:hypothetical protein